MLPSTRIKPSNSDVFLKLEHLAGGPRELKCCWVNVHVIHLISVPCQNLLKPIKYFPILLVIGFLLSQYSNRNIKIVTGLC